MQTNGPAMLLHRALVGFLVLSGILMAIAMIPLIILILAGIALFSVTTPHTPRELTRREALGTAGNRH